MNNCKILAISDFNLANLVSFINLDDSSPKIDITVAPFGQVLQVLIQNDLECWKRSNDFAIVWTQPEAVIDSFSKVLLNESIDHLILLQEVDNYISTLLTISDRVKSILIPTWVIPTYQRGAGLLNLKKDFGINNALIKMNHRLCERIEKLPNVHLLDARTWIESVGKGAFSSKHWYLAKVPYSNEVFKEAARDVKAAVMVTYGYSRKLLVVDLDETIWGGIIGDIGWQNLILGGHSAIGEAYVDFQKALKALNNRGILLAIVSKNEENIALEGINSHPEMILRQNDFSAFRINWQDKAKNISDLAADLNLGLQSVVFIDDNPFERARVKEALPEVLVPDWPKNPMLYKNALLSLSCFDAITISKEDLHRSGMYNVEEQRNILKLNITSIDEWIRSLEMKVFVENLNDTNISRAAQLFNKTNQMNLTSRRLSEHELKEWAMEEDNQIFVFRVSDKFGDYGLTGIVGITLNGYKAFVTDFILSCRVMGRRIEEVLVHILVKYARKKGAKNILVDYFITPKNKPCLDFWKRSSFVEEEANKFSWNDTEYFQPEGIIIKEDYDRGE